MHLRLCVSTLLIMLELSHAHLRLLARAVQMGDQTLRKSSSTSVLSLEKVSRYCWVGTKIVAFAPVTSKRQIRADQPSKDYPRSMRRAEIRRTCPSAHMGLGSRGHRRADSISLSRQSLSVQTSNNQSTSLSLSGFCLLYHERSLNFYTLSTYPVSCSIVTPVT